MYITCSEGFGLLVENTILSTFCKAADPSHPRLVRSLPYTVSCSDLTQLFNLLLPLLSGRALGCDSHTIGPHRVCRFGSSDPERSVCAERDGPSRSPGAAPHCGLCVVPCQLPALTASIPGDAGAAVQDGTGRTVQRFVAGFCSVHFEFRDCASLLNTHTLHGVSCTGRYGAAPGGTELCTGRYGAMYRTALGAGEPAFGSGLFCLLCNKLQIGRAHV